MMRIRNGRLVSMLFAPVLLFVTGCSVVVTEHPLSAESAEVDREKFEGAWLLDKGIIHIRFTSNGVARFASVEWGDDQYRLEEGEAILTVGKEHNFLSVRVREDDTWSDGYQFFPYSFTDSNTLVIWAPNVWRFREAVQDGHLQGGVEEGRHSTTITITNAPGELLQFINNPDNQDLWDYKNPTVLKKVSP